MVQHGIVQMKVVLVNFVGKGYRKVGHTTSYLRPGHLTSGISPPGHVPASPQRKGDRQPPPLHGSWILLAERSRSKTWGNGLWLGMWAASPTLSDGMARQSKALYSHCSF